MVQEKEQETKRVREPFIMVPKWVIQFLKWPRISGAEARVFVVLCKHADNNTHQTKVKLNQIEKESGVASRSISKITTLLADRDMIRKAKRGGRVQYEILFTPPEVLVETGVHWDNDRLPKNSEGLRDPRTGRFASEKSGFRTSGEVGTALSDNLGAPLKSFIEVVKESLDGEVQ